MRSQVAVDLTPSGGGSLLFMHIPKTAGTYVRSSVGVAYQASERVYLYDPQHVRGAMQPATFQALPDEQRRGVRLLLGHFAYGLHVAVPQPAAYVTVLRDPVDRVVSLYSHHRRRWSFLHKLLRPGLRDGSPAARERALIESSGMSLEAWVFERQPLPVDNNYVRLISGRQDVRFGECSEAMLAEAVAHIDEHFAALLVHEELARGLALLEQLIGRPLRSTRRRNVNRARLPVSSVDATLQTKIAQLNRFDVELYRLARERLPDLLARYVH